MEDESSADEFDGSIPALPTFADGINVLVTSGERARIMLKKMHTICKCADPEKIQVFEHMLSQANIDSPRFHVFQPVEDVAPVSLVELTLIYAILWMLTVHYTPTGTLDITQVKKAVKTHMGRAERPDLTITMWIALAKPGAGPDMSVVMEYLQLAWQQFQSWVPPTKSQWIKTQMLLVKLIDTALHA
jgi:hypothetical protein